MRAALLLVLACRREVAPEPVLPIRDRLGQVSETDAGVPAVDLEVKAMILETTVDKTAGTTLVTANAGANHGVALGWLGSIVDDTGAEVGRFTLLEVKPTRTLGATTLAPKQLEGKRVWLRSPPSDHD
jgi:hypothetical protein